MGQTIRFDLERAVRYLLIALVLLVVVLPQVQQAFGLFREPPLAGYIKKVQEPPFTTNGWLSGAYQQEQAAWVNQEFGFRNTLLRVHNQVGYSLWQHSYANAVVVGNNGYLFDQLYIDAWNGSDFRGEDSIRRRLQMARAVQDALAARGITLLLVVAPGKGSFFHEHIRGEDARVKGPTTYAAYARLLPELGLNYIDFRAWFEQLRRQTPYPLFPKCGIHWSTYGATLAADSMCKRMATLRGKPMAQLRIKRVVWSKTANEVDSDVGRGLNLLVEPKGDPLGYPVYDFEQPMGVEHPSLLVVGDSYFWTFDPGRFHGPVFSSIDFLYYNRELHSFGEVMRPLREGEQVELALRNKVIVIMCADANLSRFGFGFIEQLYAQLPALRQEQSTIPFMPQDGAVQKPLPLSKRTIPPAVVAQMKRIYDSPSWYQLVKEKAATKGISVDSMLYLDALYMIENPPKK